MRDFTGKNNCALVLIAVVILFVCFIVIGHFWPNSAVADIISYCSGISSLVIVLLTFIYVVTTNRQLTAMQKQLNIMDDSVKLQIQPLPVPSLKDLHLERIRPYLGPETKFQKIEILSRFHFNVDYKNAGTGAAINLSAFASILIKRKGGESKETVIPQARPEQTHLICEGDSGSNSFMIIDYNYDIFNALCEHEEVILRLKLYYKNIFGSGFLEETEYSLRFDDEKKEMVKSWKEFLTSGIKEIQQDIIRFESLIQKLPDDADESMEKIINQLKEQFDSDLPLVYWIRPKSFNVKIVNFEESILTEEVYQNQLFQQYRPNIYKLIKDKAKPPSK